MLSTQALFIRSVSFLLALTMAAVSATGQPQPQTQLLIPPQQQEWASRSAERSSARTIESKSAAPAGYVGQPVPKVSQIGYVGVSQPEPVKTQQQTEGALTAATTASKPAPFLDLTDETLGAATAGAAEPTHTDMLIRLGTWTVIIICLCGLTALAIRRWQTKHGMHPVARGQSQIIETVILGPNRSISLVELRGIQALVGCDASGIQSIVPVPPAFPDILDSGGPESILSQSSNAHIKLTA